jgi:anti-sigma factor RsiW
MSDHISDLRWDQLLAGELSAESKAEAEAHAKECSTCNARLAELTAEREAFRFRARPPALAQPKRSLRWTMPIAGALAVAAALLLVLKVRGGGEGEQVYEGTKGGKIDLMLFAGKPDQLTALSVEDKLFAGDLLQAGYSSPADGYGAVLSLDGAGIASSYVPAIGDAMVLLPAGERRSFPASTQLDDVLGSERIAVVWCHRARPLAPLLDELQRTQTIAPIDNCAVRVFAVSKAAR